MTTEERKLIETVSDEMGLSLAQVLGPSRKEPIPLARKLIIYLMTYQTPEYIASLLGLTRSTVSSHRTEMNLTADRDPQLKKLLQSITDRLEDMNLKLTNAQLGSLYHMFEDFLSMKPDSVTLELICLLIEEIKEKCRKKSRSGKENLSLDEKQLRGFLMWYHHFSWMYENSHPYGHMTLLDMISQIKPIAHAQRITLTT